MEVELPEVVETQYIERFALDGHLAHPCFWLRGLIPMDFYDITPPCEDLTARGFGVLRGAILGGPQRIDASKYFWYLDESGGEHVADPLLRRCGWGLALIPRSTTNETFWILVGGILGNLLGRHQTPARVALTALWAALELSFGDLIVKPDAKFLIDGFQANILDGNGVRHESSHADLWHKIRQTVENRDSSVQLVKVTAHQDESKVADNCSISLMDFAGNHYADRLASAGATLCEVPYAEISVVNFTRARAWKISKRLLATNAFYLQEAGNSISEDRPGRLTNGQTVLERLIERSGHVLGVKIKFARHALPRMRCRQCQATVVRNKLKEWATTTVCRLPLKNNVCGTLVRRLDTLARQLGVRIGSREIHRSHQIMAYRGLWWCARCGSHASASEVKKSGAKYLLRECRHPTKAGQG